jgi:hypothetical protein
MTNRPRAWLTDQQQRGFKFGIHERHPKVITLRVHFENGEQYTSVTKIPFIAFRQHFSNFAGTTISPQNCFVVISPRFRPEIIVLRNGTAKKLHYCTDSCWNQDTQSSCYWTCSHSTPEQLRTDLFAAASKQIWTVGRNGRDVSGKRVN